MKDVFFTFEQGRVPPVVVMATVALIAILAILLLFRLVMVVV